MTSDCRIRVGLYKCKVIIYNHFAIVKLDPNAHPKDSKTRLQEFLQGRKQALTTYEVLSISGKDHAQTFEVSCKVESLSDAVVASGNSRRKAEQEAARLTLEKLDDNA